MDVKVNRHAVVAAIAAATLGGVAGCGSAGSSSNAEGSGSGGSNGGIATLVGHSEPVHAGAVSAADVAAADTAFGFALFDKLCAAAPTSNVTLSPASAAEALGLLDAGSGGSTRAAVSKLLHLPAWNADLVAALHAQTSDLARVKQVTVTNHVFEQKGVTPTQRTLNDLQTAYAADLRQVDFANEPATTDAINSVVSHDTAGMIPNLFDRPLDPSTQTVLANAILLDATWQQPFPEASPGRFTTASGTSVSADLMDNSEGEFASRSAAGWQSVTLPYTGGDLQAVAMLPPAAATNCATPSSSTLQALTTGDSSNDGVIMPKLNLSQTLPLTAVLAKLGLPLTGDYTGLGRADGAISEVVQKVVMNVDQKGTKAAAATGVGVASAARLGSEVVTFNRPFLLLLEDTKTGTPLFMTRVADPTMQ